MDFSQFKILFPRVDLAEEAYPIYQKIALSNLSESILGDSYEYAVSLMVCHLSEINGRRGAGSGAIESETEGSVSISYSESKSGDALSQTRYGSQLRDLLLLNGSEFYDVPQVKF